MTKPFNVRNSCENCGHQTSAETAFGRWMRHHPKLRSTVNHIVRTDTDHTILRFKTYENGKQSREFQLMMCVEVKEFGSYPDDAQRDLLNFQHNFVMNTSQNRHGAKTYKTMKIRSFVAKKKVKVRHYGFHLLQFEKKGPDDSKWIKWDGKEITADTLAEILAFNVHPYQLDRPMDEFLRDRHEQRPIPSLFEVDHIKPLTQR